MHFLSKYFDFGLDLQEAMDLPRVFPIPGTKQVEVESGFHPEILAGLQAMGHVLVPSSRPIGGAQAISIDWENGTLTGASEPRKDGCAMGY
jgi:gamma-glutamyltranspeptidase/glutathione hydrolase